MTPRRILRLLAVFYQTSIQTEMEYRADFYTRFVASLLSLVTTAGSLSIAFGYAGEIRGWTFSQALVLVAIYYLMDGLIETFIAPNMRNMMTQVRDGSLDFILLKPVPSQFTATFRSVNIWRLGNVAIGLGLTAWTVGKLGMHVGGVQAGMFVLTVLAGLGVVYSFWLALVTLTFWFIKLDNLEQLIWQAFETGRYPVDIYPRWLQIGLTYVIPVVFIITVPGEALAGRLAWRTVLLAGVVALVMIVLSALVWKRGLRSYSGASA